MFRLVVLSACLALAVAAPHHVAVAPAAVAYSAPAFAVAPALAPAAVAYSAPAVAVAPAAAITKTVHYASQPVVTGYSSHIIKPDLGRLATPLHTVTQEKIIAPARSVATITPQITQVQPELHIQKVPVDVPVAHPVVSEVEVRHAAPAVVAAPAPVLPAPAPVIAAPAPVIAAPAVVAARTWAAAPAWSAVPTWNAAAWPAWNAPAIRTVW